MAVILLLSRASVPAAGGDAEPLDLAAGFHSPPSSAKPLVWWHWINGNVTKEGIEADLADMKRAGIAGAQMLDVSIYLPPGPVRYGSDVWHEHVQHAIKTAEELGLEFMMMNGPGWSASGGPWVTPERSMKKLVWSEFEVEGGSELNEALPKPLSNLGFYRDVAVIAVPADPPDFNLLRSKHLKSINAEGVDPVSAAYDGDRNTVACFDPDTTGGDPGVHIDFDQPRTVSQVGILLAEATNEFSLKGRIEVALAGGEFRRVADIKETSLASATPAQCVVPFKPVEATSVRVSLTATANGRRASLSLAELTVGNPPRLDDWPMKIKMAETSLKRPAVDPLATGEGIVSRAQVLDVTENLDRGGTLRCTLPPGRWTVLRFGYTSTGSMNHPAVPEGHGLEVDKLDPDAVAFYFDRALGRVIDEAGPRVGKAFTGILFDSFEGGPQNWTDAFPDQFRNLRGYDLIPYLPVLTGRIVESTALSEAVLYDFRTAVEELIAENYFGTMQRLAHAHGMSIYAEAQGGLLNPVSCNEYTDVPMNEFWLPSTAPRLPRIKLVSSIANLLGRKVVAAESFTAKPEDDAWRNCPATLKRSGDYAFTAGINRFVLHSYVHQPVTEAAPGFSLGRYGTHFGRLNTWWPYAGEWLTYLSRCQFLLQQGRMVADVCFLQNEDFGYSFPSQMVDVPDGYDFDICYPNHLTRMEWTNGVLSVPTGPAYRVLVLPDTAWAARVETVRRLRDLVAAGATVVGEPPVAPAGLRDCLDGGEEFRALVAGLWGDVDGSQVKSKPVGKGTILRGVALADVLKDLRAFPDVSWLPRADDGEYRFVHRRTSDGEIYFLFNHCDRAVSTTFTFNVWDRQPELWNPLTGTQLDAEVFTQAAEGTSVPLQFGPYGSMFVVFRDDAPGRWIRSVSTKAGNGGGQTPPPFDEGIEMFDGRLLANVERVNVTFSDGARQELRFPAMMPIPVNGPWQVRFTEGRGAPSEIMLQELISWTEHQDAGVKYYSGTAVYRTHVDLPAGFVRPGMVTLLDLGVVADIAEVRINGESAGVVWAPPFRLDVSQLLRAGRNELEVLVANEWVNRMIGDERVPVDYSYRTEGSKFTVGALQELPDWLYDPARRPQRRRQSFATWKHYSADSPLLTSGLLGPVTLKRRSAITASPQ